MSSRIQSSSITCENLTATSSIDIEGKLTSKTVNISTGTYTVSATDYILLCNTATGAITINLLAASQTQGQQLIVVDSTGLAATNNITIVPNGSDTIQGSNSNLIINVNNASVVLLTSSSTANIII